MLFPRCSLPPPTRFLSQYLPDPKRPALKMKERNFTLCQKKEWKLRAVSDNWGCRKRHVNNRRRCRRLVTPYPGWQTLSAVDELFYRGNCSTQTPSLLQTGKLLACVPNSAWTDRIQLTGTYSCTLFSLFSATIQIITAASKTENRNSLCPRKQWPGRLSNTSAEIATTGGSTVRQAAIQC